MFDRSDKIFLSCLLGGAVAFIVVACFCIDAQNQAHIRFCASHQMTAGQTEEWAGKFVVTHDFCYAKNGAVFYFQ